MDTILTRWSMKKGKSTPEYLKWIGSHVYGCCRHSKDMAVLPTTLTINLKTRKMYKFMEKLK